MSDECMAMTESVAPTLQSNEMTQPVILLCHDRVIRKALRAALQAAVTQYPFSIPDLPEIPKGAEPDEWVVSEAMKLACNHERRVVIIGVDRNNTVEKDIDCTRFHALIKFMPHPFPLPELFEATRAFRSVSGLTCKHREQENNPLRFPCGPSYLNIYAGKLIWDTCHALNHTNVNDFLSIRPSFDLLTRIHIPFKSYNHIPNFQNELTRLYEFAYTDPDDFERRAISLLTNATFRDFPFFGG